MLPLQFHESFQRKSFPHSQGFSSWKQLSVSKQIRGEKGCIEGLWKKLWVTSQFHSCPHFFVAHLYVKIFRLRILKYYKNSHSGGNRRPASWNHLIPPRRDWIPPPPVKDPDSSGNDEGCFFLFTRLSFLKRKLFSNHTKQSKQTRSH